MDSPAAVKADEVTGASGAVVVGLALLFLAPAVLIAPLVIGGGYGLKLIAIGMEGFY
jgi:hypothetical protein